MNCLSCGEPLPEQGAFCPSCGKPVFRVADSRIVPFGSLPAPAVPASPSVAPQAAAYAGFWLRLLAYGIDSLVLSVPAAVLLMFLGPALGIRIPPPLMTRNPAALRSLYLLDAILLGLSWLYFALMESSPWQATLGKRMLGLAVTDLAGRRISFSRASMRFFGKILSSLILFVGYVMAGFTARKQALHDLLADCLVIRKT
jgi:uncharacterized RDD family membrane protein YckC